MRSIRPSVSNSILIVLGVFAARAFSRNTYVCAYYGYEIRTSTDLQYTRFENLLVFVIRIRIGTQFFKLRLRMKRMNRINLIRLTRIVQCQTERIAGRSRTFGHLSDGSPGRRAQDCIRPYFGRQVQLQWSRCLSRKRDY